MYTFFIFLHFLGLALAVGSGLAMFRMAMASRDLPPPERGALMQRLSALRHNASWGFTALIVSGVGMVWLRPGLLRAGGGLFHAKLTLVGIMIVVMGVVSFAFARSRKAGTPPPRYLLLLRNVNITLALLTMLLAVMVFH